jgi:hypothetical protein
MSRAPNGGSAFPGSYANDSDMNATAPDGQLVPPGSSVQMDGMSLRDWFAGQALAGLTACPNCPKDFDEHHMAASAYELADAMLAARKPA